MTKAVVHRNRCLLCIHPFAVRYPFLYDGEQLPELQARPKKARRGPKVNARRGELGDCALHIADQLPQRELLLAPPHLVCSTKFSRASEMRIRRMYSTGTVFCTLADEFREFIMSRLETLRT